MGSEDSHSDLTGAGPIDQPARDAADQPARGRVVVPGTAGPGTGPGVATPSGYPGGASPDGTDPQGYPGGARPAGSAAQGNPGPIGPAGSGGRTRRTGLIVTLSGVVALALAATGVVVLRPGPVADWLGGGAETGTSVRIDRPDPPPAPVLAAAGTGAPAPTPEGVRAALDPLLDSAALGDEVNISVLDATTGTPLFERGQDRPTVPASTTKLVTAATVLATRGPAHRISTRVVAGVNPGEVVIIGGGDPTLAINATGWYPGAARLDRLAAQVKKALGATAPTSVIVDSSLFSGPEIGPGWDSDAHIGGYGARITALMTDGARLNPKDTGRGQARAKNPDLVAGQAFAKLLGVPVSAVREGTAPGGAGPAPAGAVSPSPGVVEPGTELGRVDSPPMIRLVEFMLRESDNVVAEALARQVALARGKPASFEGAAAAMDEVVAELGLPEAESALADGSGLSRTNRLTPGLLTDLLALAAGGSRPELAGIFPGLPVAGWSGTLDDRFERSGSGSANTTAGAGTVRAKTGTLTGVHAISGVVTTVEGRLLVFAVLANKVPASSWQAQPALDRIVAALARCGCR